MESDYFYLHCNFRQRLAFPLFNLRRKQACCMVCAGKWKRLGTFETNPLSDSHCTVDFSCVSSDSQPSIFPAGNAGSCHKYPDCKSYYRQHILCVCRWFSPARNGCRFNCIWHRHSVRADCSCSPHSAISKDSEVGICSGMPVSRCHACNYRHFFVLSTRCSNLYTASFGQLKQLIFYVTLLFRQHFSLLKRYVTFPCSRNDKNEFLKKNQVLIAPGLVSIQF